MLARRPVHPVQAQEGGEAEESRKADQSEGTDEGWVQGLRKEGKRATGQERLEESREERKKIEEQRLIEKEEKVQRELLEEKELQYKNITKQELFEDKLQGVIGTIDDALDILDSSEDILKNKDHYKVFYEKQLIILKEENPNMRMNQYKEHIYKLWKRSPENPNNQK